MEQLWLVYKNLCSRLTVGSIVCKEERNGVVYSGERGGRHLEKLHVLIFTLPSTVERKIKPRLESSSTQSV